MNISNIPRDIYNEIALYTNPKDVLNIQLAFPRVRENISAELFLKSRKEVYINYLRNFIKNNYRSEEALWAFTDIIRTLYGPVSSINEVIMEIDNYNSKVSQKLIIILLHKDFIF